MSAEPVANPIMALTAEHRDGTIYVDGEGDLWQPCPFGTGWAVIHRTPFSITSTIAAPTVEYGPYRAVLGPPERD